MIFAGVYVSYVFSLLKILSMRLVGLLPLHVEGELPAIADCYDRTLDICPENLGSQIVEPAQCLLVRVSVHVALFT